MNEKDELISSLSACLSICRPDEYQMRHNLLIRQLAAYILRDDILNLEGEPE